MHILKKSSLTHSCELMSSAFIPTSSLGTQKPPLCWLFQEKNLRECITGSVLWPTKLKDYFHRIFWQILYIRSFLLKTFSQFYHGNCFTWNICCPSFLLHVLDRWLGQSLKTCAESQMHCHWQQLNTWTIQFVCKLYLHQMITLTIFDLTTLRKEGVLIKRSQLKKHALIHWELLQSAQA